MVSYLCTNKSSSSYLSLYTLIFFGDCFVKILLMKHQGAFSASRSFSQKIKLWPQSLVIAKMLNQLTPFDMLPSSILPSVVDVHGASWQSLPSVLIRSLEREIIRKVAVSCHYTVRLADAKSLLVFIHQQSKSIAHLWWRRTCHIIGQAAQAMRWIYSISYTKKKKI